MRGPDAEVVVVGAGPAGAALALQLARAGRDVLVLERSRFPRDKPCGDCINAGAVAELERLGLADRLRRALSPTALVGWRVEAPDGTAFRAGFGTNGTARCGWALRRREFDAALLAEAERAGARIRFGLRAYDLLREADRTVGVLAREGATSHEVRARFVVGADGLRSAVRARLGLGRRPPRLRKIALVGHHAGAAVSESYGELRVRRGRCCGYAPLPDGANVTLVVPQREAAGMPGDRRAFFLSALAAFPEVAERVGLYGLEDRIMVTGPFDRPAIRAWARGALLVGDAAGYYDPFTGQGIHQALRTGSLAAEAIVSVLEHGEPERSALSRYGRRVGRELSRARGVQRLIEAVISRPRLMSRFIRALSAREAAGAVRLLRVTGDLDPPLSLADPVLWAQLLARLGYSKR